jgi:hypothetical protein
MQISTHHGHHHCSLGWGISALRGTRRQTAPVKCSHCLGHENWLALSPELITLPQTCQPEGSGVYCVRWTEESFWWPWLKMAPTSSGGRSLRWPGPIKRQGLLLLREWFATLHPRVRQQDYVSNTLPLGTPPLQTCCSFHKDPALCNKTYFLHGHPALPILTASPRGNH